MARKTLYQKLDSLGVTVATEYNALIRLLKIERNIFSYRFYSLIEYINNNYFRDLPADFRTPYLTVEDMMKDLGLKDSSSSLDDLFLLSEMLIAILPEKHTRKKRRFTPTSQNNLFKYFIIFRKIEL